MQSPEIDSLYVGDVIDTLSCWPSDCMEDQLYSDPYNPKNPDEMRIPYNELMFDWEIRNR